MERSALWQCFLLGAQQWLATIQFLGATTHRVQCAQFMAVGRSPTHRLGLLDGKYSVRFSAGRFVHASKAPLPELLQGAEHSSSRSQSVLSYTHLQRALGAHLRHKVSVALPLLQLPEATDEVRGVQRRAVVLRRSHFSRRRADRQPQVRTSHILVRDTGRHSLSITTCRGGGRGGVRQGAKPKSLTAGRVC